MDRFLSLWPEGPALQQDWQTLRDLYYSSGAAGDAWTQLRDKYRPRVARVHARLDRRKSAFRGVDIVC